MEFVFSSFRSLNVLLVDSWRGLGQGCWWKATEQVENIWEVGGDHTVHASILCAIQMTLARFFHSTRFFLGYDWTGLWHWKKKSTLNNTSWITSIRRVTLLLRKDLELQRMKSFLSLFLNFILYYTIESIDTSLLKEDQGQVGTHSWQW